VCNRQRGSNIRGSDRVVEFVSRCQPGDQNAIEGIACAGMPRATDIEVGSRA